MEFLFFPRQYLPEFYRGTYRPDQNLPGISMHDAGPGGHGGCMKCMLSDAWIILEDPFHVIWFLEGDGQIW